MIDLLGKRPFSGTGDDMDKWLDENRPGIAVPEQSPENQPDVGGPLPSPVVGTVTASIEKNLL
jgi:hypothetical protein